MNKFRLIITSVFLTALFSISVFAQVQPAPKIGFINTEFFYDEKGGITKLVTADKQLNTEFAQRIKELEDGGVKLQTIAKDLENMQKLPAPQFNQVSFNTKRDEGERLQRELTYKKTDLESAIAKRREVLVAPISRDIGKGIDEFSKKNGYGVILDVSKIVDNGILLFLSDSADVTKEFITFYNARPATAVTPK
jgi:Skp family chaperone for outer membrane proteins